MKPSTKINLNLSDCSLALRSASNKLVNQQNAHFTIRSNKQFTGFARNIFQSLRKLAIKMIRCRIYCSIYIYR